MGEIKPVSIGVLDKYNLPDEQSIREQLDAQLALLNKKIVVLDDDPTGVQTVHGVSVLTDWEEESIKKAFQEDASMFFILTNSRGLTVNEAKKVNEEIAKNTIKASQETNKEFILISRSDSTLRGHYPLETKVLKSVYEEQLEKTINGEIIIPFFIEGGRYTVNNIHYVKEGDMLIPAGMTEFAKDKSFGYTSSHLGEWCEEKTEGNFKSEDIIYITLEELRAFDIDGIVAKLISVNNFNKVIVNAISYVDIEIFCLAYLQAVKEGENFIFRTAAALTKVLGGVKDKALLLKEDLVESDNKNGGIVLIGSYVNKSTMQLEDLKQSTLDIEFIEFDTFRVLEPGGLGPEVSRVVEIASKKINNGQTVAIYTSRKLLVVENATKDEQLQIQVKISDAVTSIIGKLKVRPNFIIAKGGITASDVGTKALRVKRALVMGQIKPGIPVWMTREESKFPGMPYIIFPGNVGENSTLTEVVEILMKDN